MKTKKHNFKMGELVRIDKDMARTKLVTITDLYGDTTKDVAYVDAHESKCWAVDIKRLSKIDDELGEASEDPGTYEDEHAKPMGKPKVGTVANLVVEQSEQLIDFFKWLNDYEELGYTKKGIRFYVDEYLKSINCA